MSPVLRVQDLLKHYPIRKGVFARQSGEVRAVDGVSFDLAAGETLGLVGESGCGKSTLGRMIMRLTVPTRGMVQFDGRDVARSTGKASRELCRQMQIVFQSPFASLNPRLSAWLNVAEPLRIQRAVPRSERYERVADLFSQVGLRLDQMNRLPADLSGGQCQRVAIARALALKPRVLVLDEPVSALDVSVQAQVLNLLRRLQLELGLAYLFISHDLSVVKHLSDRVAVMYLGKIIEVGTRKQIYADPLHPYTQALLSAVPVPQITQIGSRRRIILSGELPSPVAPPSGCRFRTRCWKAQEVCEHEEPQLVPRTALPAQAVACHFPGGSNSFGERRAAHGNQNPDG